MTAMVLRATSFGRDIHSWDVSRVFEKRSMFGATGTIQKHELLPNSWQNDDDLEELFSVKEDETVV
jgi:hypothetical protein